MKPYLPITVAAVIAVVVFTAAYLITPAFQPPQSRINEEISLRVDAAAAMLGSYNPQDTKLLRLLEPPGTQPAEGSETLRESLEARGKLVNEALDCIQTAVNLRDDSVEGASGDTHFGATRLLALLLFDKGDLLRRNAQHHWAVAETAAAEAAKWKQAWDQADARVKALEAGLTRPGLALNRPAKGASAPEPAEAVAIAAPETAPAEAIAAAPATAPATQAPITATCLMDAAYSIDERQTGTIAQRLADLEACKQEVQNRLEESEARAAQLKPVIADLSAKIEAATARSDAAQKKMLALEAAGIDATDPGALKSFTEQYQAASDDYRKATRTITILTSGMAAEAVPTEREKEVLSDPIIALDGSITTEQPGLNVLQAELQTTQTLIEAQKTLLSQIDTQIARLGKLQGELTRQLAQEQERRAGYAARTADAARTAVTAALEAYQLETEALNVAESSGKRAAQKAQQAASTHINTARQIAGNYPDAQNARLQLIQKQQHLIGHAKALEADLDYLLALIQAQRARGLQGHARLITDLQQMGIAPQSLLAKDAPVEEQAWLIKPEAAAQGAEAARSAGVESAKAAIETYNAADSDLNRLWVLHTNIGAVHYLLANLTSGETAETHRAEARKEYEMAVRDRRERPEARAYQGVIDSLAKAGK